MTLLSATRTTTAIGIALVVFLNLSLGGCGGASGSTSRTLTSINIVPSSEKMPLGAIAALTAIGTFSDGTSADVTASTAWTSDASAVASVGTTTGVVTANAVGTLGTASITASSGVVSPPSTITVTNATLTGFTIAPLTILVKKGASTTFTATGTFSDNIPGNISGAVAWNSSDTTVATINASGIATGVSAGTCTISATSGGATLNASLTVF